MNEQPRRTLKKLIDEQGQDLVDDPRRTEAFLNDLCPAYRREIFVLVNAQRQRVPAELRGAPIWMPQQALWTRLSTRLQENLALNQDAADWAVESWADALGLAPGRADRVWVWLTAGRRGKPAPAPPLATTSQSPSSAPGHSSPHVVQLGTKAGAERTSGPTQKLAATNLNANEHSQARRWSFQTDSRPTHAMVWISGLALGGLLVWFVVTGLLPVVGATTFGQAQLTPTNRAANPVPATYPLPRPAWVRTTSVPVTDAPASNAMIVGRLPVAEQAIVAEFSPDLHWARLSSPLEGWVESKHLVLRTEDEPVVNVHLQPQTVRVTASSLNVRRGPGTTFDIVGSVARDESLQALATTTNGNWIQIAAPVAGWVSADFVDSVE